MIRILALPEGQQYFMSVGYYSSYGNPATYYTVLIGPFNGQSMGKNFPKVLYEVDGSLAQGPKLYTDREVQHAQWTGDAYLGNFPLREYRPGTYRNRVFQSGNTIFARIAPPSGASIFEAFKAKDGWTHYVRCETKEDGWLFGYGEVNELIGHQSFTIISGTWDLVRNYVRGNIFSGNSSEWFESFKIVKSTDRYAEAMTVSMPTITCSAVAAGFLKPEITLETMLRLGTFPPDRVVDPEFLWPDLCNDCVQQARYTDVNSLSFIAEMREYDKLFKTLSKLPKGKQWGSMFLALRYGLSLTVKDMKQLQRDFVNTFNVLRNAPLFQTAYSRRVLSTNINDVTYTQVYHYKVVYRRYDDDVMRLISNLDAIGILPTPYRLWDMIPLSFVVDWGLNISSILERLDGKLMSQYLSVISVTRSRKITCSYAADRLFVGVPLVGDFSLTRYDRHVSPTLDVPRLHLDGSSSFRNYAELTALIVSR